MTDPTPDVAAQGAISLAELSFVRYVLIPRAYVQGEEVDALVQLRTHLDQLLQAPRLQGGLRGSDPA